MARLTLENLPSLVSLVLFFLLHFSHHVASDSTDEANALLKWAASLQNQEQFNLSSWPLLPTNATNSKPKTSPCTWLGIYCNRGERLFRLNLTNAGLNGMLHDLSFSSFPDLEFIDFSYNGLFGTIPLEITQLSKLRYLELSNNQLSGIIPSRIGLLTNLEILHLAENQLNGSIPEEIGDLTNLVELFMDTNRLEGSIPFTFGNLTKLTALFMYQNQLSGSIPSEIGNLKSLNWLSLFGNNLSGPIPKSLSGLSSLTVLHLYRNQLSGSIPEELGNLMSISDLELGVNQLNGSIPSSLGNLSKLQWLNLRANQLSGSIPASMGNLSELQWLNLRANQLSGSIPASMGNLSELQHLILSSNQLSGSIPASLITGALLCMLVVLFFRFQARKRGSKREVEMNSEGLLATSIFDGKTLYKEIIQATKNFHDMHCIGEGGFGKVYKAELPSGNTLAVKKFHSLNQDTEVEMNNMLDQRLSPPTHEVEDKLAFTVTLAFSCIRMNPQSRPAMQFVSQLL
ncbi:hypothetical protein GH714_021825 [Hevea brasiliensis]|uniref:non-specific serine/threonine protein kinase n=1 Tax=Hevea brasiliensis TaxID=3981 RepID=A0A6A6MWE8_HEVBR|nr:hypothetical protein GH714_021825 [Hevea brasiliensis]